MLSMLTPGLGHLLLVPMTADNCTTLIHPGVPKTLNCLEPKT